MRPLSCNMHPPGSTVLAGPQDCLTTTSFVMQHTDLIDAAPAGPQNMGFFPGAMNGPGPMPRPYSGPQAMGMMQVRHHDAARKLEAVPHRHDIAYQE